MVARTVSSQEHNSYRNCGKYIEHNPFANVVIQNPNQSIEACYLSRFKLTYTVMQASSRINTRLTYIKYLHLRVLVISIKKAMSCVMGTKLCQMVLFRRIRLPCISNVLDILIKLTPLSLLSSLL